MIKRRIRHNRYKKPKTDKPVRSVVKRAADIIFMILCGVAFVGGMSLLFIFGHDMLTQCDYFKAQNIIVKGESRLSAKKIMEEAGVRKGTNILSINLSTVRKRLLADPWIAQADVSREFPGSIVMTVKEQSPLAVIDFGMPFLLNQKGNIFKEATGKEADGLPVIEGLDYTEWKTPGMPGSPIFESVMEILKMGESDSALVPNKIIKTIRVDKEIGLTLQLQSPIEFIKLGYGNYKTKYNRLAEIVSYIRQNETAQMIQEIDLRVPDNVVASLNKNQSPVGNKKEG